MTSPAPLRVLVVDDSAFARKVLRKVLSDAEGLEVVGTARDGLDALERVVEFKPDVITLDLVMPALDGLGLLKALAGMPDAPRVVVVSSADTDSELAVAALQAGAVDLVHKPTALATERLYELGAELVEKVRVAGRAMPRYLEAAEREASVRAARSGTGASPKLLAVGTSTGGPQALTRLLSALPRDFPAPVVLALHIPAGYTEAVAKRLDSQSALEVVEARDGLELVPGRAVLAKAGMHLKLERRGALDLVRLDRHPLGTPHHPSVDVLFQSVAAGWGEHAVALVLTGMGEDGLVGARAVRAAGGVVLTESESSCVVYGMPRVVDEAGLSQGSAPLQSLVPLLERFIP
ncbi:chemotaxis-specific protein-glutamate methyltransferase CheB [Corallococcus praedator]|uniref:Protein-glutamate methylesterase/protein-glutamine glutaminase n=1 Tax=Corallococcus praedator TaxID=2316724 RepID=A0ABX9Q921_9BACT|nr:MULTISPECIES: chemotaxis-specific protein-glutamate methyltransferase CheB [Corallococcus]RKH04318.1 chemotaxis-specific protein-glutamate methyltransferase CheB [Corallococcus sp. CA047B]RKH28689.1 chemotaxis-specific protein-glutamate methyltransferase CheB [Corallococcus sp. CA031C]RKH94273.1 chemotaxis-specific protein-glutamate methyltransferase CheB [Corallococcus praedator]